MVKGPHHERREPARRRVLMEKLIQVNVKLNSVSEFYAEMEKLIVKVRHFKAGKLDNYGTIVGIRECEEGRVPFVHQDHYYDSLDRVIRLEKFENDFSKPTRRFYFYNPGELKVIESVWFDRYDRIENIHRYLYNNTRGLLIQRAEYTKEGEIFYAITSRYDDAEPAHLLEELWTDVAKKQIKRHEYSYDEKQNMSEERMFDNANSLIGSNHFVHDDKGRLLQRKWHNSEGIAMSSFVYDYDENDDAKALSIYDSQGNLESWQEFSRDALGNVKEEKWYDGANNLLRQLRY
jgi:hypothetical protein